MTARAGTCCTRRRQPRVPYVTQTLKDAPGVFVAASDYMKVLPDSRAVVAGQLVALGTDGFGRSESRASLRDFFEVDAKHIVLATLPALAGENPAKRRAVTKASARNFWRKQSATSASIRKNAIRPPANVVSRTCAT